MSEKELRDLFQTLDDEDLSRIASSDIDASADPAAAQKITAGVLRRIENKGGVFVMEKKKYNKKKLAAVLIAAALLIGLVSVAGATGLIRLPIGYEKLRESTGLQLSENMQRIVDAENAKDGDIIVANKTVQSEGFTITLEGIIQGSQYRHISIDHSEVFEGDVNGYYAVVTVTRDDGGMVYGYGEGEDEKTVHIIGASPLIHTVWPNMVVYSGMSLERETGHPTIWVEDNVLYLFIDITEVLCYADKGVSIAVFNGNMVFDPACIDLDENGVPFFNGTRSPIAPEGIPLFTAMFELPLDEKFADPEAQRAFEHERPVAYPKLPFHFGEQDVYDCFADPVWLEY